MAAMNHVTRQTGIPTGFHHPAQGCEERATLGQHSNGFINPERVASLGDDDATELLSKEWLCFFKANGKLLAAKSDSEIAQLRVEVWKAYIADHKALYGNLPHLSESDKAELLADDEFICSLSEATKRPKSPVSVVTWQLFRGWIVKNYYRMNDETLQKAFNKDWSYKTNQHKGNTLAKHARSIGLRFALKRGRPELPNSLPSG